MERKGTLVENASMKGKDVPNSYVKVQPRQEQVRAHYEINQTHTQKYAQYIHTKHLTLLHALDPPIRNHMHLHVL